MNYIEPIETTNKIILISNLGEMILPRDVMDDAILAQMDAGESVEIDGVEWKKKIIDNPICIKDNKEP